MARKTIRPDGRKHQIPRCLYGFFGDLEAKAGIEFIKGGRFLYGTSFRNFNTHIQFYNETARIFRVRVRYKGFTAYFNVKIYPEAKEEIKNYIKNYRLG